MPHYKVLVRIGMDSGLPADAAVNTWHCDALSLPSGYEDFVDDLEAFYQAIDGQMSSAIDPSALTATVYRMADPEPRAPVYVKTFSSITTSTDAWPPELSVCLSFQGVRTSGQSQARRRGRVYLGPLAAVPVSGTNPQISPTTIGVIQTAAQNLLDASDASATYTWCVYSVSDDDLVEVDNGWIDNAVDIQRRRGLRATTRSTFFL